MKIIVVAKQTAKYWYTIDKNFESCPTGSFQYNGESALKKIEKRDWKKEGQCSKKVEVKDISIGLSKNTFPFKITQNQLA